MSERGNAAIVAGAASAAALGAVYMGSSIAYTLEAVMGLATVAAGVLVAEVGGYAQDRLLSWLWPLHLAQHVGAAMALTLVPLFFLRAPTGVWVGTILNLFTQLKQSPTLAPLPVRVRRR